LKAAVPPFSAGASTISGAAPAPRTAETALSNSADRYRAWIFMLLTAISENGAGFRELLYYQMKAAVSGGLKRNR
jgi:hypothetical protein